MSSTDDLRLLDEDTVTLPRPAWASEIIGRLNKLPEMMSLREDVARLTLHVQLLLKERHRRRKEISDARNALEEANKKIAELEQIIIGKLRS